MADWELPAKTARGVAFDKICLDDAPSVAADTANGEKEESVDDAKASAWKAVAVAAPAAPAASSAESSVGSEYHL